MKESALLPLLRSRLQGDVLTLLYLHPDEEYSVTALARNVDASVPGVHHEVTRLIESGLIRDRRVGNSRMVSAEQSSPITEALTQLLLVTYGPRVVIADELAAIPGVDFAFIYGSWAARYQGERGMPPGDVDVLTIGTADLDGLDLAAERASDRLHRDVHIRRVSAADWAETQTGSSPHPFLTTVAQGPLVGLELKAV